MRVSVSEGISLAFTFRMKVHAPSQGVRQPRETKEVHTEFWLQNLKGTTRRWGDNIKMYLKEIRRRDEGCGFRIRMESDGGPVRTNSEKWGNFSSS